MGSNVAFIFTTSNPNPDLSVESFKRIMKLGTDIVLKDLKDLGLIRFQSFRLLIGISNTDNAIYPADAAPSTGTGSLSDNAFGLASNGLQIFFEHISLLFKNRSLIGILQSISVNKVLRFLQ